MNKCFYVIIFTFFLTGCFGIDKVPETGKVNSGKDLVIDHYNLIIAPDLSNRLTVRKKPVPDTEIVDSLLASIYPRITTFKRKMNQLDKYRLDIINPRQIIEYNVQSKLLTIDLGRFSKQLDRINYLGPFQANSAFKQDKAAFSKEFKRITKSLTSNTAGSDIWTYLNEAIDNFKVDTTVTYTSFEDDRYINSYKNVIILLTDGYIESNNNEVVEGKRKVLPQSLINSFRDDYNKNGKGLDLITFLRQKGYGILPLENPLLKHVDILVMEIDDRSQTKGGATKSPTDFQIIRAFWSEWFRFSGVRKFEFVPISPTAAIARDRILKFISIQ